MKHRERKPASEIVAVVMDRQVTLRVVHRIEEHEHRAALGVVAAEPHRDDCATPKERKAYENGTFGE